MMLGEVSLAVVSTDGERWINAADVSSLYPGGCAIRHHPVADRIGRGG
jgi:hypothetical protein